MACGFDLAGMRTQRMHLGTQGTTAPGKRVEGHRRGQIRRGNQVFHARQGQHRRRQHLRRAVVQRQAFLERQANRREADALQGFGPTDALAIDEGFATAEQDNRQVRQRCEVATGTHRALGRNHRDHVAVEQGGQGFECGYPNARVSAQQGIDADCQDRPHDIIRQRLADADRVGDQQVVLQLLEQAAFVLFGIAARQLVPRTVGAEQLVGIAAETRGHAIHRLAATDFLGEEIGRALHALQRLRRQRHVTAAAGNLDNLRARQRGTIELDRHARAPMAAICSSSTRKVFTSSARGTSN